MTDVVDPVQGRAGSKDYAAGPSRFEVDETYWGFIIRGKDGPGLSVAILQGLSMFFGACMLAVAIGLVIVPQMMTGSVDMTFRIMAAVFFLATAAFLLWFGTRGVETELQIDNTLGEVREVLRNRTGKSTLIGRYGYDTINSIYLDRSAGRHKNEATLMLRFRNSNQLLPVARGSIPALEALRNRLGQDLILDLHEPGKTGPALVADNSVAA
jgi:hypothetical protein